jgi:hypothetical protein
MARSLHLLQGDIRAEQRAHLESAIGKDHSATLEPVMKHLLPLYARNEAQARRWQKRFNFTAISIYILSALAVTVSIVQYLFFPESEVLVLAEILMMVLALSLIVISRRLRWQNRWLESRHLAERLRVAMFTGLIPDFVRTLPDPAEMQKHYRGPEPEMLRSVAETMAHPEVQACRCNNLPALRQYLAAGWIRDQARYHKKVAGRRHSSAHIYEWALILFFGLTLLSAVLHLLHANVHEIPILLSISLPAWAAATHGINDLLDHERIAERSHNMAKVLEGLAERMETAADLDAVRKVAGDAEWIMMSENLEWLVSSTFHKPPVVAV